ncbi:MAG: TolC family protein [Acidobacteriota bacterium]
MRGSLFLLAAVGCAVLHGQAPNSDSTPGSVLTLEDCIRKALAVPSAVSIARMDRSIADKDHSIARAGLLPQASANFDVLYTSPSRVNPDTFAFIPANAIREYVGLGRIFQEIDTSGRIRAEIARARANQRAAQASTGIAERDLKHAVGLAYYRLLLARRLVEAIRSSLQESESFEQRVKRLEAGGEAARADVVKASAQVAILRQTLTSAELAATLANQDLAAFWTADVDPVLAIRDVFDEPVSETAAAPNSPTNYLRRFEFSLLDAQRSGFQADAKRTKALLLPQLSMNFTYGLDSYRVEWQHRGYAAVASVTLPVFDWFRTMNASKQFTLRAQQVAETRSIAERRYSQEYSAAMARVNRIREQIVQAKEQMALAEEDFKLSRIRYEGGEGAAVDVVVAQGQLVQARSGYYTSVASYLGAKLDLEVAAGR